MSPSSALAVGPPPAPGPPSAMRPFHRLSTTTRFASSRVRARSDAGGDQHRLHAGRHPLRRPHRLRHHAHGAVQRAGGARQPLRVVAQAAAADLQPRGLHAERQPRQDAQLVRRVLAAQVARGVRLREAARLRIRQRVGERPSILQPAQDVVRRPVQDPAHGGDPGQRQRLAQGADDGDAARRRALEVQPPAVLPCRAPPAPARAPPPAPCWPSPAACHAAAPPSRCAAPDRCRRSPPPPRPHPPPRPGRRPRPWSAARGPARRGEGGRRAPPARAPAESAGRGAGGCRPRRGEGCAPARRPRCRTPPAPRAPSARRGRSAGMRMPARPPIFSAALIVPYAPAPPPVLADRSASSRISATWAGSSRKASWPWMDRISRYSAPAASVHARTSSALYSRSPGMPTPISRPSIAPQRRRRPAAPGAHVVRVHRPRQRAGSCGR